MSSLRGHHLICLHFYDGEGYDAPFIKNLEMVLERAREEGVTVVEGADEVCAPCRHRRGTLCTFSGAADREIRQMDTKALDLLDLGAGRRILWSSLREAVFAIFPTWHETCCFACSWRPVCEKNDLFRKLSRTG